MEDLEKLRYRRLMLHRLREYMKAESAILAGQEYVLGDRHLRRPDLKYVQQQINDILAELQASDAGRGRTKRTVFVE